MWFESNGVIGSDFSAIDDHPITSVLGFGSAFYISEIDESKALGSLGLSIYDHHHFLNFSVFAEYILYSFLTRRLTQAENAQYISRIRIITWTRRSITSTAIPSIS